MRRAFFLLALVAGCGDEDNDLVVTNVGGESVLVLVDFEGDWDDDEDQFVVPAGAILVRPYDTVHDLDVVIFRQSDRFLLFADSYDQEDFDDEHGDIEIVVAP